MYTEDIVKSWLKTLNVHIFDISSNGLTEVTIVTENGAFNVIVDDTEHRYGNLLAVTAISSFVWKHRIPYIIDCYYRILPYVTVHNWGWLYHDKYDIILKTVKDRKTDTLVTTGYQIKTLQQLETVRFFENCCGMVLREQWLLDIRNNSVLFLVPITNPLIERARIEEDYFLRKEEAVLGGKQDLLC